jgi:hypothetical protein
MTVAVAIVQSAAGESVQDPLTGTPAKIVQVGSCQIDVFKPGVKIFTNRKFTLSECPDFLNGVPFWRGSIDLTQFRVVQDGVVTVLTPESEHFGSAQYHALEAEGFVRIAVPALFQLFGENPANKVRIYQKQVLAGETCQFDKWTVVLGFDSVEKKKPQPWSQNQGKVLYNGICLPTVWPPEDIDPASMKPMAVPYLDYPPRVIPIDTGRQLLVDDFLIEETDLKRTFHYPEKYEGNPVLQAETELEKGSAELAAGACPKSGGLWWDPDEQVFKLWYEAGWLGTICYATSTNGLDWVRPETGVVPGSNQVLPVGLRPDSWTVVRDWWTDDPAAKYKIFVRGLGGHAKGAMCFESPDGIDFGEYTLSGVMGDRSTMFYNPFRKKWIFSLRSAFRGRSRHYWEADDFIKGCQWPAFELNGSNWQKGQPVLWAGADELDPPDPEIQDRPQLYNLDAVAYESIMLGFYQMHRGPGNFNCKAAGTPKITELNFAYSRDGFHWARPDRTIAIKAAREAGAWDRGYVQSLGNICVLRGDKIWFYYTGYSGDESRAGKDGHYVNGAMGVATLRRDGFASMNARSDGTLITRPLSFSGKHLFVNADVPDGALRVDVLDENGNVVAKSVAFEGDSTLHMMTWNELDDLSAFAGQPVRFRFDLEKGALYSFWVSQDESGRSDGYVAGGGPGYTGPTDTVGIDALDAIEANLQAVPVKTGSAQEAVDVSSLPDGVKRVEIFLLAGQSNMKGAGAVPDSQPDYDRMIFMSKANDQWYSARHPLHTLCEPGMMDEKAGVGPGIDFAAELLKQEDDVLIALVPCAKGGSWINLWLPEGEFYEKAISRVKKSLSDFPEGTARLAGILWLQGESDAIENRYPDYEEKLDRMVADFRDELGAPDLPFVACTIGSFIRTTGKYKYGKEINKALLGLPDRVANTACVDARDLKDGHVGDFMHYNTESHKLIGERYAAEYFRLIRETSQSR